MPGRGAYYKNKYARSDVGKESRQQEFFQRGSNNEDFGDSNLNNALRQLEGKSYNFYKDLRGTWNMDNCKISIDRVQSDPYAPPSGFRVHVDMKDAGFPPHLFNNAIRNIALSDFLNRRFVYEGEELEKTSNSGGWSSSKGGDIRIDRPSQHVLSRTAIVITNTTVEARCLVNLPARGRSIEGYKAATLICEKLPKVVRKCLFYDVLDQIALKEHIESVEDQEYVRSILEKNGLTAFVIDGACLPRISGNDDIPMKANDVVLTKSPESWTVTLPTLHRGNIIGMGIKKGVTLVVGGGFHGKSTLLSALQCGIYNHIPGDGREFVVVSPDTVKIRAEDGRFVAGVDISCFINNLPFKKDTSSFHTDDASGSTSQASSILEAIELGSNCLLMDEDTCAANFMTRDARMKQLVSSNKEPITAFIYKVRSLLKDLAVSTILVAGATGDFFDVADMVIMMDSFKITDATVDAKKISKEMPSISSNEHINDNFGNVKHRKLAMKNMYADDKKIKISDTRSIFYGANEIELQGVEQIVEKSQIKSIADLMFQIGEKSKIKLLDGNRTIREILDELSSQLNVRDGITTGVDLCCKWNYPEGFYSLPRKYEIGAAINRLRSLKLID
eukprot:GHVL01013324.1.p1 GENE.GHVL01013324.1~~GHVL01013324.1.p1  ORF type:complete len:617 (+),score=126.40 GHVL01013324.1:41-1891(+)